MSSLEPCRAAPVVLRDAMTTGLAGVSMCTAGCAATADEEGRQRQQTITTMARAANLALFPRRPARHHNQHQPDQLSADACTPTHARGRQDLGALWQCDRGRTGIIELATRLASENVRRRAHDRQPWKPLFFHAFVVLGVSLS